jgi:hypothetical protein
VERVISTLAEADAAIEAYVHYYNQQQIHSTLDYRTLNEFAAAHILLAAASTCLVLEGHNAGGRAGRTYS